MKIFLIAYGILALVSFFLFTVAAEINAKETNSAVGYEMVSVSPEAFAYGALFSGCVDEVYYTYYRLQGVIR